VVAGIGPRATPAVDGTRVFTQGATGILNALDLETGRKLWSRQVVVENGAQLADWGKSASPLVVGGRVVVSAGGRNNGRALVAYDAATGEPAWAAGRDPANYSSPTLLTIGGRAQIVILNRASIAGHDPDTGALLWEAPFPAGQPNIALPVALGGDRILASAGYGVGSRLYAVSEDAGRAAARLVWESPRLKSKFANLVVHDGSVYGLDDGVLTCLDPATGERRWKEGRYGHGQLLLVGGLLLVQTEEGELALVEPSPEGRREIALVRIFDGKTWNPPALAGDVLYVRSDREAAAVRLPTE
jgi:outer membrane protein assembly factor BamB